MIGLTRQEKQVLVSLVFVFCVGTIVHYVFKVYPYLGDIVNVVDSELIYPKINVNEATAQEISNIPYIGDITAKRIVEYRKINGPFKTKLELRRVKGIGEPTYRRIEKFLKI